MEFLRGIADMRARTALVLFLASIVAGGVAAFTLALATDSSLAASATRTPAAAKAAAEEPLHWREMGPALDEAKSSGKTIVVDVYTDWCGWCKRMDRDTYAKPEVRRYLDRSFVPVRLNAEANTTVRYLGDEYSYRELAQGFRINSYPMTLFLGSDGKQLARAPGYMGAADFLTVLRYFGDGHFKKKTFQQYQDELAASAKPDTEVDAKTH